MRVDTGRGDVNGVGGCLTGGGFRLGGRPVAMVIGVTRGSKFCSRR